MPASPPAIFNLKVFLFSSGLIETPSSSETIFIGSNDEESEARSIGSEEDEDDESESKTRSREEVSCCVSLSVNLQN